MQLLQRKKQMHLAMRAFGMQSTPQLRRISYYASNLKGSNRKNAAVYIYINNNMQMFTEFSIACKVLACWIESAKKNYCSSLKNMESF